MFLSRCSVLWVHWGGIPTSSVVGPPSETIEIFAFQNPENGPGPWVYVLWVHTGRGNLASLCTVTFPSKSFFLHYMPYLSLWIQADNVFCWYKFLQVLVDLPCNSCESKLSGEKRGGMLHRYFMDKCISIPGFSGWLIGSMSHTPNLFSKQFSKQSSHTLGPVSSTPYLDRLRIFQIIKCWFPFASECLCHSFCALMLHTNVLQQEETRLSV